MINDGDDNAQNGIVFCIQCDSRHKDQCFRRLGVMARKFVSKGAVCNYNGIIMQL